MYASTALLLCLAIFMMTSFQLHESFRVLLSSQHHISFVGEGEGVLALSYTRGMEKAAALERSAQSKPRKVVSFSKPQHLSVLRAVLPPESDLLTDSERGDHLRDFVDSDSVTVFSHVQHGQLTFTQRSGPNGNSTKLNESQRNSTAPTERLRAKSFKQFAKSVWRGELVKKLPETQTSKSATEASGTQQELNGTQWELNGTQRKSADSTELNRKDSKSNKTKKHRKTVCLARQNSGR